MKARIAMYITSQQTPVRRHGPCLVMVSFQYLRLSSETNLKLLSRALYMFLHILRSLIFVPTLSPASGGSRLYLGFWDGI